MQGIAVRFMYALALSVLVSGCASVSLTSDDLDAEGKRFSPPPDKANIYVTRTSFLGGAVLFQVFLDGKLAGSIAPNTYLLLEVEPGKRQVIVITQESQHAALVDAARNGIHFLEVIPKMGFVHARAEIQPMTEEEGKKAVQSSKRAELLLLKP